MYKVVKYFTDLQDNSKPYNVGDTYPRKGLTVSAERIAELASSNNLQHTPLIEEVVETAKPKAKPKTKSVVEDTAEVDKEEAETVDEPKKATRRKRK